MSNSSKVWFITGSSTGLGRALAEAVLARGQRVVATARKVDTLTELATQFPATCRTLALDVTDAAQVKTVVPAAAEFFGRKVRAGRRERSAGAGAEVARDQDHAGPAGTVSH